MPEEHNQSEDFVPEGEFFKEGETFQDDEIFHEGEPFSPEDAIQDSATFQDDTLGTSPFVPDAGAFAGEDALTLGDGAPEGGYAEYQEQPLEEEAPQSAVNRPASGARQVAPGEVFSMDFQGSENAGDFLGLDMEFTESAGDGLELAQAPTSGHAAEGPAGHMMSTAPPTEQDAEYGAEEYGDVYEGDYEDDYQGEFAEGEDFGAYDEYGGEEGELGELEFDQDGYAAEPKSRRGLLVGGAVFVGILTVAAVTLGPKYLSKDGGEIASGPRVHTTPTPTPAPAIDPLDGESTDPVEVVDGGGVEAGPVDPEVVETGSEGPSTVEGWLPEDGTTDPEGENPFDLLAGIEGVSTDPVDAEGGSGIGEMTQQLAELFGMDSGPAPMGEFPDMSQGEFEWVSEDMLDMIWRGPNVPQEAIFAPARTLMPRVGFVLVHMTTGEVFQGRLYAVGQGKVWLDTDPGRLGLDGAEVARFEVVPIEAGGLVETGQVVTGERIRASVPGGWLYGRVLTRAEGQVTLVTDDGARIVLKDTEVETLRERRPIIVSK